ncbi:hypothetical protein HALLA_00140 (plasmid) [Halostagnicola larsenii XH-48]|uniref:Polymerase nucleotidyl transferase domain-containing protein n=1 Tax=Halostagnicola larsenii XH-48 TaxID=797299 RepID=W0JWQ1_9EURY|nr:nucleotidyltransferase domain-containing protein [Halostagnicola larsenii]AHG01732.1 hypothetical protein HALLA_00140 [Halostagnicola larsenii XH-48]
MIAKVLCFGSVARGEADRTSGIDVFVLVDDTEAVPAQRTVSDDLRDLEEESSSGDRYEFEVFVESPESARNRGADLQPVFQEGISLLESETLRRVKRDSFGVENDLDRTRGGAGKRRRRISTKTGES